MDADVITKECLAYIAEAMRPGSKLADAFATVRGGGSYKDVYKASEMLAEKTKEALIACVPEEAIEDAALFGRIGTDVVARVLRGGHADLVDIAAAREAAKLQAIKLGLRPIKTAVNETRISDIAKRFNEVVSSKEFIELAGGETLPQFYGSALDEFCQENATFQYEAGLSVVLVRSSGGESCAFCDKLCGFTPIPYNGTPDCGTGENLFARHKGCKCAIDVRTERGGAFNRVRNYTARR